MKINRKHNSKLMIKKPLSVLLIFSLIIAQVFILVGCGEKPAAAESSFGEDWLLNTYCYIKSYNPGEENEISSAFKLSREYENKLSKTIEGSLTDILNKAPADTGLNINNENIQDLTTLLLLSSIFSKITDNKFDVTVGNLTDIWDFTSGEGKVPSDEAIQEALKYTGEGMLSILEDGSIIKADDKVKIDFGAIAKGYIADKAADCLRENGVQSAILSYGGNIICIGQKPDQSPWQIGIEKPKLAAGDASPLESRETIGTLICPNDYSVVTSGTYERYISDDSTNPATIYHHILDPQTGYSANTDLVSASIVGPHSVVCDCLATCAILLGSEDAKVFLEKYNESLSAASGRYEYVLITDGGEIIKSDNAQLIE